MQNDLHMMEGQKKTIAQALTSLITFDLRSLSLMRIGIGITLLIDACIRFSNIEAHYSDKGVLPLEAMIRFGWNEFFFSFFSITGSVYIQTIIFLIYILCICALIAGYRTKIASLLCWLFIISIHNRNTFIHQGGDDLLRLLLFWGLFLPWNAYFSLDRIQNRVKSYDSPLVISLAGAAYMLQVGYVYFFSALLKTSPEWTSDFTAIYYALSIDQIALPLGKMIYPYASMLKLLTRVVFYMEFYLPFILLIPFMTSYLRMIFVFSILSMHIGISLTMNVGLFPMICCAGLIGLLPGSLSEKLFLHIRSIIPHEIKAFFIRGSVTSGIALLPVAYKEPWYQRAAIVYLAIYVFNWNLLTLKEENLIERSGSQWLAYTMRIDQHWGMFSPGVFKDDGWFIFEGKTKEGKMVDLLHQGKEISYQKRGAVARPFTEDRWRKYSENILFVNHANIRPYYCYYLLNKWNSSSGAQQIDTLRIIYMKEVSLPDYKVPEPSREVLCDCFVNNK